MARVKTLLVAERTPASWQRQMAHSVADLDVLRRASAWLDTVMQVLPRLSDGPLLGQALTALTAGSSRQAHTEPIIAREKRSEATGLMDALKHGLRPDSSGERQPRKPSTSISLNASTPKHEWLPLLGDSGAPLRAAVTPAVAEPAHRVDETPPSQAKRGFTGLLQHTNHA